MIEFEEIYNVSEEVYNKEYSHGEYCHEQSFKWGFQEGVKWIEENYIIKPKNKEIQIKVFDNSDELLDFINSLQIELVNITECESYFSVFYKAKDNYENRN